MLKGVKATTVKGTVRSHRREELVAGTIRIALPIDSLPGTTSILATFQCTLAVPRRTAVDRSLLAVLAAVLDCLDREDAYSENRQSENREDERRRRTSSKRFAKGESSRRCRRAELHHSLHHSKAHLLVHLAASQVLLRRAEGPSTSLQAPT